jgi:hypothetical protein
MILKSKYDWMNCILMPLGFVIVPHIVYDKKDNKVQKNTLYYLGRAHTKNLRAVFMHPKLIGYKMIKEEE